MPALLQRLLQLAAASDDISYFENTNSDHDAEPLALILPRLSGFISLLAVCCVFVEAGLDLHESVEEIVDVSLSQKHQQLTSHVQVFYQIPLLFFSMAFVWGTSPVPSSVDVWGAYGNTTTCTAQGFMLQFGLFGSLAWNAVLSISFLRMAQGKSKSRLCLFHCLVWPIVLAISVYPLTQDLYHFNYNLCWINNENHDDDDAYLDNEVYAQDQAAMWHGVTTLLAMVHLISSVVIMICLYRSIRVSQKLLNGSTARTEDSTGTGEAEETSMMRYQAFKSVALQGMLYSAGVVLIILPAAVYMILFNATGLWSSGLSAFAVTLTPLVGYVNFIVFMRNRRLEDCHTAYARLLKMLHSCCFCRRHHKSHHHDHHDAPREVIPINAAAPEEPQSVTDKQKVIAFSRDGQLDTRDVAVVVAPPTSFLGGFWNQLAVWWTDSTDESVAASDCGVILQTKHHQRRRKPNGSSSPPQSVMGDRSEANRSHSATERASNVRDLHDLNYRSQRTVTTTPFDQHDSFPSQATPPSMPIRVASEQFSSTSESFRESCESQTMTLPSQQSYVDAAPPTRPVRYETDHSTFGAESTYGGESTVGPESTVASFNFPDASTLGEEEASSYAGENSTFAGESTLASVPDSVQQAIVIEYYNRNAGTTPPSKPVRYDTDADESAVSAPEERAPRQPLRYDTCSEKEEESDMEESIETRVSGAPAWARHILRQMKHSEEGVSHLPPSKPTRYDSEVESVLTSLADGALDVPDLEATGQVMPPDWAIQYLRKVAKSEQSHATASQASAGLDEECGVEVQAGPPMFEVVASKNAPKRPLRYHSDVSEQSSFA